MTPILAVQTDLDVMVILSEWQKDLIYSVNSYNQVIVRLKHPLPPDSWNRLYDKTKEMGGWYDKLSKQIFIPLPQGAHEKKGGD